MNKKGRLYQKGRLCFRFLLAAAVVAAALYSCSTIAANTSAAPNTSVNCKNRGVMAA